MSEKIINIELNELPPKILSEFINIRKDSMLSKLYKNGFLKIYNTLADDVPKKKLYPSQTWASFNTGIRFQEHNCYWYSDPIDNKKLLWNKLVEKNIKVGVLGSLHSSKYPKDLYENDLYKFYIPDCFSEKTLTKPNNYSYFQKLNFQLVASSARITKIKDIFFTILNHLKRILKNPQDYGISFFSIKLIIKSIFWAIRYKNKEFLRMCQFPLYADIFLRLLKKDMPDYSCIFSNHLAGNMHRYWYAYRTSDFKNKNRYSVRWIKRNRDSFFNSMELLDEFLIELLKIEDFGKFSILITSSMGQEANPSFDNYQLSSYDGKIVNIKLFLDKFYKYKKENNIFVNLIIYKRNMAPQYGFEIKTSDKKIIERFAKNLHEFVSFLGLQNKIDVIKNSVTVTIDPAGDNKLQTTKSLKKVNKIYSKYGFVFNKINDHHSGAHSEIGTLAVINSPKDLNKLILEKTIDLKNLNYLSFSEIIYKYFSKNKV